MKLNKRKTSPALRGAYVRIALLCAALLLLAGTTYAWYIGSLRAAQAYAGTLSADELGYRIGYDVFKFDETRQRGIQVSDEVVAMNLYDKVYPTQNANASIILRAVLSDEFANLVDENGTVKLVLSCNFDGIGRDVGDTNGDGIIDYLSNVINVKAAYIPNITDIANAETYGAGYASADDYIYRTASAYFDARPESVRFVEIRDVPSATKPDETSWSSTDITTVDALKSAVANQVATTSRTEDGFMVTEKNTYAYVIMSGTNSLQLDGATVRRGQLTGLEEQFNNYGMSVVVNGISFSFGRGGYFLTPNNGNLAGTGNGNQPFWTGSDNGGIRLTNSNYSLRYNNNTWSASTRYSAALTIRQIKKTVTSYYRPGYRALGDKLIQIDANLGEEFRSADGMYYIYLQIDYDQELINSYFLTNHLVFTVGNDDDLGLEFRDIFQINVADQA